MKFYYTTSDVASDASDRPRGNIDHFYSGNNVGSAGNMGEVVFPEITLGQLDDECDDVEVESLPVLPFMVAKSPRLYLFVCDYERCSKARQGRRRSGKSKDG